MPYARSNQFLVGENIVVCWVDECTLVIILRLVEKRLEITPILDGIEADLL